MTTSHDERTHVLKLSRFSRGMTQIGNQTLYGTKGKCSCGWSTTSNEAPRNGGQARVKALHTAHVDQIEVV